jgi:hypothetical protein
MSKVKDPNRFEEFVDFDTDGAAITIGLQHFALGPPAPSFLINTGALQIQFTAHSTDIDVLIEGLTKARKKLRKWEVSK